MTWREKICLVPNTHPGWTPPVVVEKPTPVPKQTKTGLRFVRKK